ncbi:hypothetical protein HanPSC8_Chr05g0229561 [Helianthus annuus]|nr:hypothetical protein HanPSC8_Chr05g0229561 [Helianthus annuus]
MSGANPSLKKKRNKSKNPPGPDQATIGWKEEEFHNLVREMGFLPDWGAQFPTHGSTAMDAPPGYITLYAAFFREGNFRLPMTKFTAEVLRNYGLHISQINAIGLPRVTLFEFVCRANHVESSFEMFNVFYTVTYTSGFYSFNSRTGGVIPCFSTPLKSLHDWKQKIFYIRRGVIPVDMHYRSVSERIPKIDVLADFAKQEWYKKVTHKATAISQLEEMALVGAGMSLRWFPKNSLGVPVYGYQGKFGYSLLNVLDPKAAGAMVEAIQEDGKPTWLDQIRSRFLHPTNESLAAYANVALGEDDEDDAIDPTREEVVVLSSGSSDRSFEGLTSRYARTGPARGAVNEPVNEPVGDDVEVPVEPTGQLETRRKTKANKPEGKEKGAKGKTTETPRKRPSTLPVLDYIVVSDTLSGLGVGDKHRRSDPDDRATLTEMMRKKALEEKKRKLDEQAAAMLASKKARLQKETPPAPSESEIDLGPSGSGGVKPVKAARRFDISQITPPASPPSRTFCLSTPPEVQAEKGKQILVEVEQVGEGGGDAGGAGDDAGGDRGKGIEMETKSSEATHRHTIYTRCHPAPGGGGTSGNPHGQEFEHVQAGSWDTHNPACDDLPHAPRWKLTQGSRMSDLNNCHDFFSLSPPPAERLFQKRRPRFDLLDDHVRAGVNYFATSQEIVREWKLMGEETLEFENEKRAFAEEREKFNAEKKGLLWRVADAEQKL